MGAKKRAKTWQWLRPIWARKQKPKPAIGILTFEVSRLISKAINLWQSISDDRIAVLRDETLILQGVRKLISDEEDFLLSLFLAETMNSVHLLVHAVARLGSRCSNPILHRFEHVFNDLIKNDLDLSGLGYSNNKRMEREVKRMKKLVAASSDLYQEAEMLAELESDLRRAELNPQGCDLGVFKKRVFWQRQAVKNLQDVSVWNRSYDFVARILARALYTIVARIRVVFGFHCKDDRTTGNFNFSSIYYSVSGVLQSNLGGIRRFASGPLINAKGIDRSEIGDENEAQASIFNMKLLSLSMFESKRKSLNAPPSTLGAASLDLHYANVILVIEKLAASPNSIGPDVRDELYRMLPRSIRITLKTRLSNYAKNLGSCFCDAALADEWSDAMIKILNWLSPLAHNMIKWQSDRNVEKQNLVSRSTVLLMQTLYYANQEKTEAAITELLVGLNYLWRYGRELNAKAVLDCAGGSTLIVAGRKSEL